MCGDENLAISELVGKTLTAVDVNSEQDIITFTTDDGTSYLMYHSQNCCESVNIEDICGDLADLVGSPVVQAEESSNSEWPWTFYRIATAKGLVVIRWFGSSNGCYSESVEFCAKAQER